MECLGGEEEHMVGKMAVWSIKKGTGQGAGLSAR